MKSFLYGIKHRVHLCGKHCHWLYWVHC